MSKYKIAIFSDQKSWINEDISIFIKQLLEQGHQVRRYHNLREVEASDFAFYLSFGKIVPKVILDLFKNNLVVHESALPKGKGWSPVTWQILEGCHEIPVTLFEAEESLDSGPIYSQTLIRLRGDELVDEIRTQQSQATFQLCEYFIKNYPTVLQVAQKQVGEESFYPKRGPKDSILDVNKSLKEQFNLLRVVDNEQYPAYFFIDGQKYIVKIYKDIELK